MELKRTTIALALAAALTLACQTASYAQQPTTTPTQPAKESSGDNTSPAQKDTTSQQGDVSTEKSSTDQSAIQEQEKNKPSSATPATTNAGDPVIVQQAGDATPSEEEKLVLPYYSSVMKTYRLGPEDVISIYVFGQDRYTKTGITVPPDGRISYYLIPEGIEVAGKTTRQIQEELTKRLDEYIIDPKVTVMLDKAMSARYMVVGDVTTPGMKIMTRRVSILEAIAEAGGVTSQGNKKKVVILRQQPDGQLARIQVNVSAIEKGKGKELVYLEPGDQVIVPGGILKTVDKITSLFSILSFARIFGLPF
jgi:polysaccharide export outer membrane protein